MNIYDAASYGKAIRRSIEKANVSLLDDKKIPYWTSYQLRHSAVTEIVAKCGLDVARAVAGQKSMMPIWRLPSVFCMRILSYLYAIG